MEEQRYLLSGLVDRELLIGGREAAGARQPREPLGSRFLLPVRAGIIAAAIDE